MPYKIAVVGIGKIAIDQHLPCIAKNKNFHEQSKNDRMYNVSKLTRLAILEGNGPINPFEPKDLSKHHH